MSRFIPPGIYVQEPPETYYENHQYDLDGLIDMVKSQFDNEEDYKKFLCDEIGIDYSKIKYIKNIERQEKLKNITK